GAFSDAVAGAVAGIITMIPEGLVLLTSVAFAVGVIRLGRRRCLVQELPAIEVLARVDVLCLDKTGTLTEPGMELDQTIELVHSVPVRTVLASLVGAEERPNAPMQAAATGLAGRPAGGASAQVLAGQEIPAGGASPEGAAVREVPAGDAPAEGRSGREVPAQKSAGRTPALAGALGGETRWRPVHVVPFSSARKWSGAVFAAAGPASGGWVRPPPPLPPPPRPSA